MVYIAVTESNIFFEKGVFVCFYYYNLHARLLFTVQYCSIVKQHNLFKEIYLPLIVIALLKKQTAFLGYDSELPLCNNWLARWASWLLLCSGASTAFISRLAGGRGEEVLYFQPLFLAAVMVWHFIRLACCTKKEKTLLARPIIPPPPHPPKTLYPPVGVSWQMFGRWKKSAYACGGN